MPAHSGVQVGLHQALLMHTREPPESHMLRVEMRIGLESAGGRGSVWKGQRYTAILTIKPVALRWK